MDKALESIKFALLETSDIDIGISDEKTIPVTETKSHGLPLVHNNLKPTAKELELLKYLSLAVVEMPIEDIKKELVKPWNIMVGSDDLILRMLYNFTINKKYNFDLMKKYDHDANVLYILGHHIAYGIGCKNNPTDGLQYIEKAIKLNHPDAYNHLGEFYRVGAGNVLVDNRRALECYIKGDQLGSKKSASYIGHMYTNGLGTKKNYDTAMSWYNKYYVSNDGDIPQYPEVNISVYVYFRQKYNNEKLFDKLFDKLDSLSEQIKQRSI